MRVDVTTRRGTVEARTPSYTVRVEASTAGGIPYEGTYDVTPSGDVQTLATAGRTLAHDVTVGAIPSNYGLITYDGTVITVS